MPGSKNITWKEAGQIKAVEGSRIRSEVGNRPSHEGLGKKQKHYDEKELDYGALVWVVSPGSNLGKTRVGASFQPR